MRSGRKGGRERLKIGLSRAFPSPVLTPGLALVLTFLAAFLLLGQWAVAGEKKDLHPDPLKESLKEGIDLLFNNLTDRAEAEFKALAEDYPGNPAGDFYVGLVYHERLKQDPGSEKLSRNFHRFMDRAIEKSAAHLREHPDDALALSYMGSAYALKGRLHLKRKSYLEGTRDLREGIKLLKQAVALEPDFADAYFCLGYYNYFAGIISPVLSFWRGVASLPGGDRMKGLEQLHRVMEEGELARPMAKFALMDIYTLHEKKPKLALQLAQELAERYLRNPYLKIELGLLFLKSVGDPLRARTEFKELLESSAPAEADLPADVFPRLHLAMAQAELAGKNLEGLRAQLEPILNGDGVKPRYIAPVAHLLLGEYYTAKGEKEKALLSFRRALSFGDVGPVDWQAVLMGYPSAEAIRQAARAKAMELRW